MVTWVSFLPVLGVAMLVMLVPGLALGAALRLRGLLLWGMAPAAGTAMIAVAAVGLSVVGLRWSPLTAMATFLLMIVLAAVVGRLCRSTTLRLNRASSRRSSAMLLAALFVGAVIGVVRMAIVIGDPSAVSQTNDATFHFNVLRFIEDSGSASSLTISGVLGSSAFYPAAWHGVTSLVMALSGVGPVQAANAVSLLIAGPVWTVTITALVAVLSAGRALPVTSAALLAPSLFAFPFHMLDFGVLYPYALSIAVVPGVIAVLIVVLHSLRHSSGHERVRRLVLGGLLTLVGLAAIALAQPATLLVWVAVAASWATAQVWRAWKSARPGVRVALVAAQIGVVAVVAVAWVVLGQFTSTGHWGPLRPAYRMIVEMLFNSTVGRSAGIVMGLLAVCGFITAVRRTNVRWWALFSAGVATVTLVAVSVRNESIRNLLLGAWYGDPHRLLALMPLVVIPLAALGIEQVSRWGARRVVGPSHNRRRAVKVTSVFATVLVALGLAETGAWIVRDALYGSHRYETNAESFLSPDERALLEDLSTFVPEGERVLGNPSAGAAFGYALSGIDVYPRTWQMPNDDDFQTLRWDLVNLADDPAVCEALSRVGTSYVLDFGIGSEAAGRWIMPGMTGFEHADGFELVAEQGDASLWRVTGCPLASR